MKIRIVVCCVINTVELIFLWGALSTAAKWAVTEGVMRITDSVSPTGLLLGDQTQIEVAASGGGHTPCAARCGSPRPARDGGG